MVRSWIQTVSYEESADHLRRLCDHVKGPEGQIDKILSSHSLRPHMLKGHMALYKSVLHHGANRLPKWFLEALGVYVSLLNDCSYCVEHHYVGLKRLLKNATRAERLRGALERHAFTPSSTPREASALSYARTLSQQPQAVTRRLLEAMREVGYEDGEILEINQVYAFFACANRTVLGLGTSIAGDTLGLLPRNSSGSENWSRR